MTVTAAVQAYLGAHPFIEEALTDGIINYAGLARHMHNDIQQITDRDVKSGAIIMALKRLSPSYYYRVQSGIKQFFERIGPFTVRSDISDYTFQNTSSLLQQQKIIMDRVAHDSSSFYSFSMGLHESTIVASNNLDQTIANVLGEEKMISKRTALATLTTLLPKENTELSGIYYFIFKQLACQDINVVEVISTTNEFTVVVGEKDIDRSFRLLRQLKRPSAKLD
ncbi:MAG: aspartate kinase [Saprospiraceae bacterium]|nr:aspartate kinase [Saprospiraceae bacterium]